MPQCIACGREIAGGTAVCPACEATQSAPGVPPPATSYVERQPGAPPVAPAPARQGGGMPGWAIALIVVAVVVFVAGPIVAVVAGFGLLANVAQDVAPMVEDQIELADERAVRDGVTSIQAGVEAWAADHGGRYPAADKVDQYSLASQSGLGYVDPWPQNPYAGGAMTQGRGEGQYLYVRGPKGGSYTLTGYGAGGVLLIALP